MGIPARPSRVARFLRGYCSIGGMGSQPVNPPLADGRAGMTDLLGRGEVWDVLIILSGEGISTLNPLCSG